MSVEFPAAQIGATKAFLLAENDRFRYRLLEGNMTPFTMKYVRFLAGPSGAFPGGAEDWRPLLRIKLRSSDGKEVRLPAWIDSGCDICLFPLKFALALGWDPAEWDISISPASR